jgi:hypothetical protein
MDFKQRKSELEAKFAENKKKEEQAVAYLSQIREELLRQQGEWRLLEELGKEAPKEVVDKPTL